MCVRDRGEADRSGDGDEAGERPGDLDEAVGSALLDELGVDLLGV